MGKAHKCINMAFPESHWNALQKHSAYVSSDTWDSIQDCYSNQSLNAPLRDLVCSGSTALWRGRVSNSSAKWCWSKLLLVKMDQVQEIIHHQIDQLTPCRADTLRLRQSLTACRVGPDAQAQSWQFCSESTVVTLFFFQLQLLQLKAESVPSRLYCWHSSWELNSKDAFPNLLLEIYLPAIKKRENEEYMVRFHIKPSASMSRAEHIVHKHINPCLSASPKSRHSPISPGITFYLLSGQ